MGAAIYYHPEGYDTSKPKLMGRHAAGEAFLAAYARHGRDPRLYCYAANQAHFADFRTRASPHAGTKDLLWIPFTQPRRIAEPGALFLPGPGLGDQAWQRRQIGDPRRFSIIGITHTTASHQAMDAIAELLLAPVEPWDALICTSGVVRATVERLVDDWAAYFVERGGTPPPMRAQLPVIPLGVDCEALAPVPADSALRAELRRNHGIGSGDIVVLFFGRLSFHAKANPLPMYLGLEQAAQATGRRIHLILAGWFANQAIEEAFREGAQALCPSVGLIIVDGRDPDVRRHIWSAADIFTSLSDNIQETFGLTPLEAMAAGLPVVVSDWNGYRDTVRDGIDGFTAPTVMAAEGSGVHLAYRHAAAIDNYDQYIARSSLAIAVDVEAVAQAYQRLIENEDLRRRMGEAGRRRAMESFDWRHIIARYEALWQELGERRRRAPPEAAARPLRGPARPSRPDPFRLFATYSSFSLGPDVRLSAVPGADAARLAQLCRLKIVSLALDEFGTREECESLLKALAVAGTSDVATLVATHPSARHLVLARTLVWLAKIGLIRLAAPARS